MGMPLGRYFAFTGSLLLALLFLADWYIPKVAPATVADVDRTIIRIHSAHKWPEAINIDTSLPTIVPPTTTVVAETAARPAPPASRRAARRARIGDGHTACAGCDIGRRGKAGSQASGEARAGCLRTYRQLRHIRIPQCVFRRLVGLTTVGEPPGSGLPPSNSRKSGISGNHAPENPLFPRLS